MSEARHGRHWLRDMDADRLTPMARLQHQDYFVFEPALLTNGRVCMPTRWFTRGDSLHARAWAVQPVARDSGSGWRVDKFDEFEVSEAEFLVSFKNWSTSDATNSLPSATEIFGESR